MAREPLRLLRATAQRARTAAVSPLRRFRRPSHTPSPATTLDPTALHPTAHTTPGRKTLDATAPNTPAPNTTALDPAARPRPLVRAAGLAAVTVLGAWIGLLVVGSVHISVGPMDTRMALRPSLTGGTKINVAPLGALELDSHQAPLRLDVAVDRLDPVRSQALVDHPERLSGLQDEVASDITHGTLDLAFRSCAAVVFGATALGLAVYRRPRRALAAGGLAAHNPIAARETDGTVPLALTGHVHHRRAQVLPGGTRLMTEGSTGGSGLRAVDDGTPDKVQASVLYLDRDTRRLQAWDEIDLGGLGLAKAEVSRHLPAENRPGATPTPTTP
ncbi:hypothetical protein AB0G77_06325 [Streptomyces hygroscopicus]|uniref:hypothetical protein n=1 Tax=Streptomyces hygroscopicus TaxID=1912 RepID=UPI0034007220